MRLLESSLKYLLLQGESCYLSWIPRLWDISLIFTLYDPWWFVYSFMCAVGMTPWPPTYYRSRSNFFRNFKLLLSIFREKSNDAAGLQTVAAKTGLQKKMLLVSHIRVRNRDEELGHKFHLRKENIQLEGVLVKFVIKRISHKAQNWLSLFGQHATLRLWHSKQHKRTGKQPLSLPAHSLFSHGMILEC